MYWAGDAKSGIDRQDDLVCQSKSLCFLLGLPRGSDGKESACNARNPGLIPGSGRSLGEKEWQPPLVFLPGEFHGQESGEPLTGC